MCSRRGVVPVIRRRFAFAEAAARVTGRSRCERRSWWRRWSGTKRCGGVWSPIVSRLHNREPRSCCWYSEITQSRLDEAAAFIYTVVCFHSVSISVRHAAQRAAAYSDMQLLSTVTCQPSHMTSTSCLLSGATTHRLNQDGHCSQCLSCQWMFGQDRLGISI